MRHAACLALLLALLAPSAAPAGDWTSEGICAGDRLAPGLRLQEQRGRVSCADGVLVFEAGPKTDTVGKAALILPFPPAGRGILRVAAEVFLPEGSAADSLILVDAECKRCGLPGNPGLRLYLRDGALRVDRKKIGERHAWAAEDPPRLVPGSWARLEWELVLGGEAEGRSRVRLNGETVLESAGRTLPRGTPMAVDRVQIGLTANSNPDAQRVLMRAIRVDWP
jgi:hypothetical protein